MSNLLILGKNVEDIAKDIWKNNTNYTIAKSDKSLFNFKGDLTNTDMIIIMDSEELKDLKVPKVLKFVYENDLIPILIGDKVESFENDCYFAFSDIDFRSIYYIRNKENAEYNEFIKMCSKYITE